MDSPCANGITVVEVIEAAVPVEVEVNIEGVLFDDMGTFLVDTVLEDGVTLEEVGIT